VVLVTLRCGHLLDGLVAYDSVEARKKIVRCSGGGFMRGIVLSPWALVQKTYWRQALLVIGGGQRQPPPIKGHG
jgi:hypothetical protein